MLTAGNGKLSNDNCGADGYVNYIDGTVIAAANQLGKATHYSERCSAIFATAYSGDSNLGGIVSMLSYIYICKCVWCLAKAHGP